MLISGTYSFWCYTTFSVHPFLVFSKFRLYTLLIFSRSFILSTTTLSFAYVVLFLRLPSRFCNCNNKNFQCQLYFNLCCLQCYYIYIEFSPQMLNSFHDFIKSCVCISFDIIKVFIIIILEFSEVLSHVFLKCIKLFDKFYYCSLRFCILGFISSSHWRKLL